MTQQERGPEVENSLIAMLSFRRPAGSRSERKFISQFIWPLGVETDRKGNLFKRIGTAPIMWSSHTDSVHRMGGLQDLIRVGDFGIGVSKKSKSNCLGADDAAGVWLMREMILANVPGLYVFHREEESGGHGSKWIAKNNPKLLDGIKYAVAPDRRDKEDVITFQSGLRCCSDEFAASISDQLGMGYKACTGGSFTDTANYTGLIGECTNLSVGYDGAHSANEKLDAEFLLKLRDKLLHLDVSRLVEKRKAGEYESKYKQYQYGGATDYGYFPHHGYYSDSFYSDDAVVRYQYSLLGKEDDLPRAGSYGYWDANGAYHTYSSLEGGSRPFSYKKTGISEAEKDYEMRDQRKRWWQRLFEKAEQPKVVKRPSAWGGKTASSVKALADQRTTAKQDEQFFQRTGQATYLISLERMIRNHPAEVGDFLEQCGYTAEDISRHILETTGILRAH
jgi:hypothetical protein